MKLTYLSWNTDNISPCPQIFNSIKAYFVVLFGLPIDIQSIEVIGPYYLTQSCEEIIHFRGICDQADPQVIVHGFVSTNR